MTELFVGMVFGMILAMVVIYVYLRMVMLRAAENLDNLLNVIERLKESIIHARIEEQDARQIARDTLAIAGRGLSRRERRNAAGEDEAIYLAPLQEIVDKGSNLAESRLTAFKEKWRGSIDRAFSECVLPL